jgi:hypothetical protein
MAGVQVRWLILALAAGCASEDISDDIRLPPVKAEIVFPVDVRIASATTSTIPIPPLAIDPIELTNAAEDVAYTATITASGGRPPYIFALTQGRLPIGLALTGTIGAAVIDGISNELGLQTFELTVTDVRGQRASRVFELGVVRIGGPLEILTATIAPRAECSGRRDVILAAGGAGAGYVWSTIDVLPPGLILDPEGTPATTLHGRATAAGSYSIQIRVEDFTGASAERTIPLVVDPAVQRHALLVGDLAIAGEPRYFLADVCGDTPSLLMQLERGGFSGGSIAPAAKFSPDGALIAHVGDGMTANVSELFLTALADPSMSRRISFPQAGAGVRDIFWSPDSRLVVYLADQNTPGVEEIFVVDVSGATPTFPVQVNAPLAGNSDVTHLSWSPDSRGLIYRADPTDEAYELFYVDLSVPTLPDPAVRLHDPLAVPQNCDPKVEWSDIRNAAIFRCDAANAGVFELWYVRFTNGVPGAPARANDTLVQNGDVQQDAFAFSSDGNAVLYLADQNTDEVVELYLAITIGGPIAPGVRAMAPLAANQDVTDLRSDPTRPRLLIRSDLTADDQYELFQLSVGAVFPFVPERVNAPVTAPGGDVALFDFSSDGDRAAFSGTLEVIDRDDLWVADISGTIPGAAVRATPANSGSIASFRFAPDSRRIALLTEMDLAVYDLGASSFQIVGSSVLDFDWRASSDGLFFRSESATAVVEGFSMDLSGLIAEPPVRLHSMLGVDQDLDALSLQGGPP